jgi:hypothetical protein
MLLQRYRFIPLAFNLLSSLKDSNHYQGIAPSVDQRTNGYKSSFESMLHRPDAGLRLIKSALDIGISADYVLMDTGLQRSPSLNQAKTWDWMSFIGMVKQMNQSYTFHGKTYKLEQLKKSALAP